MARTGINQIVMVLFYKIALLLHQREAAQTINNIYFAASFLLSSYLRRTFFLNSSWSAQVVAAWPLRGLSLLGSVTRY